MIDTTQLRMDHPELLEDVRRGMMWGPAASIGDEEIAALSWAEAMEYWLIAHNLDDQAETLLSALITLRSVGDDDYVEEDQRHVGDWMIEFEEIIRSDKR